MADAGGSINAPARAPQSGFGPRFFLAKGQNSGRLAAASFSMMAHLVLTPDSGTAGSTVTVAGFGFNTSLSPNSIYIDAVNIY